jgi:hypothetical protein
LRAAVRKFEKLGCLLRKQRKFTVFKRCRFSNLRTGTDVMILKIFSPQKLRKNGIFGSKQSLIMQIWIITLVFEKNTIFSPKMGENR